MEQTLKDQKWRKIPRIAICRHDFPLPSEPFIEEQARSLTGWCVEFFCNRKMGAQARNEFPIRELRNGVPGLRGRLGGLGETVARQWNRRTLRSSEPDLILIHFGLDALFFWPLVKFLHVPVVIYLHGYDVRTSKAWWKRTYGNSPLGKYPEMMEAIASEEKVRFLTCSESLRHDAIGFGIPRDRLQVAPLGIDTDFFVPTNTPFSNRKNILFIGRLVEKKGCHLLIQAFLRISQSFPETCLKIIGDGPLRDDLEKQAAESKGRVLFLGTRTQREIARELSMARLYCLPSITAENGDAEGMPVTILEAQSCGVPVITSAKGGVTEGILDEVTGIAFQENNQEALERHLLRLLSDDESCSMMGAAGRKHMIDTRSRGVTGNLLKNILTDVIRSYDRG
jgi:colanic acid/amylovoran biosynthesis glycosyltransferase